MASFKQHAAIGAAVGGFANAVYQLIQKQQDPGRTFDWAQLGACTLVGAAVGTLADVIEPATSPNHRAFFHSFAFAAVGTYASHGPHTEEWRPEQRAAARLFSYCYLSHLAADAGTPKGLPWI
jgi:membrane-bound metal-dependent hydrolase YbcI (DUF457 family)